MSSAKTVIALPLIGSVASSMLLGCLVFTGPALADSRGHHCAGVFQWYAGGYSLVDGSLDDKDLSVCNIREADEARVRKVCPEGSRCEIWGSVGAAEITHITAIRRIKEVHAEAWRTYFNSRFGTTAQVPWNWHMEPPPANGDGRRFTSPNGRATISIYGSFAEGPTSEPDGSVVTYKKQGRGYIVVSGIRGDTIFYHKEIATCRDKIWNNLWVEYPVSDKEQYDSLVTHVSASLRGGHGLEAHECK